MNHKIILYGIFYIILTSFFLYIFKNEKKIAKKISKYPNSLLENAMKKFNIVNQKTQKIIKTVFSLIENIAIALVLVVVIQRFYIGNFVIPTGSMIPTIEIGDRIFADMVSYKFRMPRRNEIIIFKEPLLDKVLYTKRAMGFAGEKVEIKDDFLIINNERIDDRRYLNLGIGDKEWVIPKKGDKLTIIPSENFSKFYNEFQNIDWSVYESLYKKKLDEMEKGQIFTAYVLKELKFILNDSDETGKVLDFIHNKKILNDLLAGKTIELVLEDDYVMALGDNTVNSFDSRYIGFVASKRIRGRGLVRFWPLSRIGLVK